MVLYGSEYDAITGQRLPPELIKQGRALEMEFLGKWEVYSYASYDECLTKTGNRPIKTKWVQTNKGDDVAPNVRCRWVAREFRTGETCFAATAPYETI